MSMFVDFHSHILPGIDDGSRSVEESVSMLRQCAAQGIREVILTPHFYPQRSSPQRFLEKRANSLALLTRQLDPEEGLPALRCGAEVYYYPHMSHSDDLRELRIQGTDHVLVEMPSSPWTDRMYRELEDIYLNQGLTPIVAHVDRYLGRFLDHGIPQRLSELPVLVQANASFFLNRSTGAKALRMLREKRIHVLGSDCHNTADRAPNLGPAARRIVSKLGTQSAEWIRYNECRILRSDGEGEL